MTEPSPQRLAHFPVSFFSTIMGTAGLSIAFQRAAHSMPVLSSVGWLLLALAAVAFVGFAALYGLKLIRHADEVKAEFAHPIRLHFVPTISIGMLLLSIGFLDIAPGLSRVLLAVGAPLHLILTFVVLNQWLNRDHFQVPHLNPAWFIPIVGNILVPIPAVTLGYGEIAWLYFAIGIVFWPVLFAIILNRVLFHQPLPERMVPTLFILIAPPAVGFLSYLKLTGSLDAFARVLYFFALFLVLFLATQLPRLARLPFYLSWWAYSFPLAAVTIASYAMHEKSGLWGYLIVANVLLAITATVIGYLIARTAIAASRGQICVPE